MLFCILSFDFLFHQLIDICGEPFMLLGFGFSCCTTARKFEVREFGMAKMKLTLGQFVHKSSHPSMDTF